MDYKDNDKEKLPETEENTIEKEITEGTYPGEPQKEHKITIDVSFMSEDDPSEEEISEATEAVEIAGAEAAAAANSGIEVKRGEKKGHRAMPLWGKIIVVILVFILILILAISVVVNVVLGKINRPDISGTSDYYTEDELEQLDLKEAIEAGQVEVDQDGNVVSGTIGGEENIVYPELNPEDVEWTKPSEEIASSDTIYNLLLIGQDAREGESRARSDSMILVTFNKTKKTIAMTSFLRDLYVQIPGYSDNRINAAYAYGGMELLDETIEENFSVEIDGNLEVRFEAFEKIIDILGGVDIDLTSAEANYLGMSAGVQHMNGETALSYARIRYIDSDFYRTGRQRNIMTCVYNNFKNASVTQINQLINQILPLMTTDLSNSEIVSLAAELVPMISGSSLTSQYIPADGTYSFNTINSMAVIVADLDANRELLKETLE